MVGFAARGGTTAQSIGAFNGVLIPSLWTEFPVEGSPVVVWGSSVSHLSSSWLVSFIEGTLGDGVPTGLPPVS